ncbi:class F sortase [Actinokineospora bangkokensis]|nr:class F sortase [Actinokineospora bangkokensis]
MLIGALSLSGPSTVVEGIPYAAPGPVAAPQQKPDVRQAAERSRAELAGRTTAPAPPAAQPPAAQPSPAAPATTLQAPAAPPARQPAGQKPGTVRLAHGGTATLVRQELGPDATLPVPTSLREATWWGAGLDSGTGATVLAGHVNWRGQVGPFAELWAAKVGDAVSVVGADGRTYAYRIAKVDEVRKEGLPQRAEELFGQTGPHRLVLVTCGGRWVGGHDGYESNLVVTAVPA